MNREQAVAVWAPQDSPWSQWTKPVLFSFMSDPLPEQDVLVDQPWKAVASSEVAIVVDLPGIEAVLAGLQLARSGYRPILLFNACPYALDSFTFGGPGAKPALVDVMSIMQTIEKYTAALSLMSVPGSAPPAFLLDKNRSRGSLFPGVGVFDNRSIVREADLPSGEALTAAGIRRVVLLRSEGKLGHDLHEILLSWQNQGLQIETQLHREQWRPVIHHIERRNAVSVFWDKLVIGLAFRTNSLGSFGRTVRPTGG